VYSKQDCSSAVRKRLTSLHNPFVFKTIFPHTHWDVVQFYTDVGSYVSLRPHRKPSQKTWLTDVTWWWYACHQLISLALHHPLTQWVGVVVSSTIIRSLQCPLELPLQRYSLVVMSYSRNITFSCSYGIGSHRKAQQVIVLLLPNAKRKQVGFRVYTNQ